MGTHCLDATVGERVFSLATLHSPWDQTCPLLQGLAGLRGKLCPRAEDPDLPPTDCSFREPKHWRSLPWLSLVLLSPGGGGSTALPLTDQGSGSVGLPVNTPSAEPE